MVATVVIDSTGGSVIQSSGHYSLSRSASANKGSTSASTDLEELAAVAWKYVKSTETLIADLDSEV